MNFDLSNSTMVVLGGTSAIGRAIVHRLTGSGANVVFQGTNVQAAEAVAAACADHPGRCEFKAADLMSYDDVEAVFSHAEQRFGPVRVAVCSGGSRKPPPMLFNDMTPEQMIEGYNNRIVPRLFGLKAAAKFMIPRNYGKVILLSTDAGRTPTPTETIIGSAGAFVNYLARTAGRELSRNGIRVNSVAITITEGTKAFDELTGKKSVFDRMREKAAFGLITPVDVASYVHYLAAPESDRISGSTMSVNGGVSFPGY